MERMGVGGKEKGQQEDDDAERGRSIGSEELVGEAQIARVRVLRIKVNQISEPLHRYSKHTLQSPHSQKQSTWSQG